MHYHCEIVLPPTCEVEATIAKIMAPFQEEQEDNEGYPSFWDWYVIGGRWAGYKAEKSLDQEKLKAFRQWLKDEKVMVSGLVSGKESLADGETINKVDAKWQEMFPGQGECSLFQHSNDQYKSDGRLRGDVMLLRDLPAGLTASRVIIAQEDGEFASAMYQKDIWNGVSFLDTTWDGIVASAISSFPKSIEGYQDDYKKKNIPTDEWQVVTVDYHS